MMSSWLTHAWPLCMQVCCYLGISYPGPLQTTDTDVLLDTGDSFDCLFTVKCILINKNGLIHTPFQRFIYLLAPNKLFLLAVHRDRSIIKKKQKKNSQWYHWSIQRNYSMFKCQYTQHFLFIFIVIIVYHRYARRCWKIISSTHFTKCGQTNKH